MRTSRITFFWSVLTLFAATGCSTQPEMVDRVRDMIVQTNYVNTTNFASYATYAMPMDTIGHVFNQDPNDTLIVGSYAKLVTATLKSTMDQIGYTQVGKKQSPDLALNAYVVEDYSVFQSVGYSNFYGGYGGGYYPGYYYPGYYGYGGYYGYPFYQSYSVNTATLVLELVDLKNKSNKRVLIVWNAYAGDLLTSVDTFGKTSEAIQQAFKQSPYIKK